MHETVWIVSTPLLLSTGSGSKVGVQVRDQPLFTNEDFTDGITAWDNSHRRFGKLEEEIGAFFRPILI